MVKKATVTWSGGATVHDDLAIAVEVVRWGNTSFDVQFAGTVEADPVFEAVLTYVAVETGTKQTVRVPDAFRAAAGGPPSDGGAPDAVVGFRARSPGAPPGRRPGQGR